MGKLKAGIEKDALMVEGRYESGKLKKQGAYQNDLEAGEETFWFENGKQRMDGRFTNPEKAATGHGEMKKEISLPQKTTPLDY